MSISMEDIPIIDTHLHLWDIRKLGYPWLDEEPPIKRSFLIEDYQEATKNLQIEKMVFVQSECFPEQNLKELEFVSDQARKDHRIQGIVAYAPLEQGKGVRDMLHTFKDNALVKGVRRMYDKNPNLCYSSSFLDAVNLLPECGLSFDISTKPYHMQATIEMIKACPSTQIIIDHLGKPDIKKEALNEYKRNIETLASLPNVVSKISGLITEADREKWTVADLMPYIAHAIECFGHDRLMFGGDWPVVLLGGSYKQWLSALLEAMRFSSRDELSKVLHNNAVKVYKL